MKSEKQLSIEKHDALEVADCDLQTIENLIHTIRGQQVLVDRDLAMLYKVETKVLNQAVKRNLERFPTRFRFQLSKEETHQLVTNCDRFNMLKHSTVCPYAFTEQGVAMLSTVLRSEVAIETNIKIMDAFVAMRHLLTSNSQLFQRLETLEYHQLEMQRRQDRTDNRIDEVFEKINRSDIPQ